MPFVANSALEVVALHLLEAPRRASTLVPDLPRELDDLVLAMMAKDAAARPALATVCEVVERAKHAPPESAYASLAPRASEPAMDKPLVAAHTLPHAVPRRSAWWIAVPVSALLLGGIAFVVVQALSSSDPAATPVVPPVEAKPTADPPKPIDVADPPKPIDAPAPAAVVPPPQVEVPIPKKPIAHIEAPAHAKPVAKPKKPDKPKIEPKAGSNSGEMLIDPGTLAK